MKGYIYNPDREYTEKILNGIYKKDDVEKGLEMGAEDYLIKAHFKPSEVVDKVKKILKIQ